ETRGTTLNAWTVEPTTRTRTRVDATCVASEVAPETKAARTRSQPGRAPAGVRVGPTGASGSGGRRSTAAPTPMLRPAATRIVPHTPTRGIRTNPAAATPTTAPRRFSVYSHSGAI